MVNLKCSWPECEYETGDIEAEAVAVQILSIHNEVHKAQPIPLQPANGTKEKIRRPTITSNSTMELWNFFLSRWNRYKKILHDDAENITVQLLECVDEELLFDLHRNYADNLDEMPEKQLLESIKRLAVKSENTLISRVNMRKMTQDHQEDVRHYVARLRGQANLCDFLISCPKCKTDISYADAEIGDQLCAGVSDPEIQREILGALDKQPGLEEIVCFIEAKESGKRSQTALGSNAYANKISEYKKSQKKSNEYENDKCGWCGRRGHGKRAPSNIRFRKCPAANHICAFCGVKGHFQEMCFKRNHDEKSNAAISQAEDFLGSIEIASVTKKAESLSHAEYSSEKGWITKRSKEHPQVTVGIEVSTEDYAIFNIPIRQKHFNSLSRIAIVDTGAMIMVAGRNLMRSLGLDETDLFPVETSLTAAGNSRLNILGGVFLKVQGKNNFTKQICYIQDNDSKIYLSRNACENLGIIPPTFPTLGSHEIQGLSINTNAISCNKTNENSCNCPIRKDPPKPPTELPFPAVPENTGKLKNWILDYYKASTFNTCENQQLKMMSGLPLKIDIDPDATPVAINSPIPVPIHWQKEVKSQLDRDVALGVIEPVPWGEPTTWCSRMVIVAKTDGSPRRTIDLTAVNNASMRQTHHTPPPFQQAMSVPHNTLKTVFDAWNGYHSLPIREEDRHLTTFITPWGRYRYKSALQGFLASGDAYTRRYDEIIASINNKTKCVDDTLLWQNNLENAFHQACEYLSLCGESGITLNPKKFQFAQESVEFAGFTITPTSVKPSKKHLEAILNFPTPKDITGVRSWFGLVNQSAYAFSMTEKMGAFRDLLKPGNKFQWNDDMQKIFDESKEEIVNIIKNGVKIFDPTRRTALATDWSRTGTGFSLLQKHCNCQQITPRCCNDGWKLVFAGSQFNSKAEAKYSPIEGEALAIVKGLHKTRYFVLGCSDLLLVIDHKPLLKVFGDRKLEEIHNPRLLLLKEKALPYRFNLLHIPGKSNKIPDAVSRYPPSTEPSSEEDNNTTWLGIEESACLTVISTLSSIDHIETITWNRIQEATISDPSMVELSEIIQSGFKKSLKQLPSELKPFHRFKNFLSVFDGVITYKNRIVIPPKLRQEILDNLHSAHQGTSSMKARIESSVFWPGIYNELENIRDKCYQCHRMAPSQPDPPPTDPVLPDYPFQCVCADYCCKDGNGYLVIVDRYSNWPIVHRVKTGEADGKHLISALRNYCGTFGIPEEIATDGGPPFSSDEVAKFLKSYGIQHRVSSVAYPHSNCRAELGVKTIKRLLTENIGRGGTLDTDKVLRALLQYRNTPDPSTKMSPAQIVFGRQIRDFTPVLPGKYLPRKEWQETLQYREAALRKRHIRHAEKLTEHTRRLPPLRVGDHVIIQNQTGNHPRKWDKTGTIIEVKQFDQYIVKVDGSGRSTTRNRKFLRKIQPFHQQIQPVKIAPPTPLKPTCKINDEEAEEYNFNQRPAPTQPKKGILITAKNPENNDEMPTLSPQRPVFHGPCRTNNTTTGEEDTGEEDQLAEKEQQKEHQKSPRRSTRVRKPVEYYGCN